MARELVEEAERLRGEWTRDSLREAVERYADAVSCWRAAGARAEVSGAQLKTGDIHFALSEYEQARVDYAQALKGFKAVGDRRGQAAALYRLGLVYSYIGDTEIGEDTNIGAGGITANFAHKPGMPKKQTRIGSNVRTGIQNGFVAPVEVGDGAWIAAGSTITKDVPAGSLAIGRPDLKIVEGYTARRRSRRQTEVGKP